MIIQVDAGRLQREVRRGGGPVDFALSQTFDAQRRWGICADGRRRLSQGRSA
jgi:hypothetical protein